MTIIKKRIAFPALWLVCITWLSTKGGIPLPGFSLIGTDKLAHAAAYGLFAGLVIRALLQITKFRLAGVWLFATLYGALMELVQYKFFPNRFFEYDDMLANSIGALLVCIAIGVLKIGRKS